MNPDTITRLAAKVKELAPKAFATLCEIDVVLASAFPESPAVLALSAACAARKVLQKRRRT